MSTRLLLLKRLLAKQSPLLPRQRKLTPSQAFAARRLVFIARYR